MNNYLSDKINELYSNFFKNRNINSNAIDNFLKPDFERGLINPFILKDMDKAIIRLKKAIDSKEKILLYTDYDCDGIPGATILYDFFRKINYDNFENYIPHRHKEGYGLHLEVLERYINNGYTLMITADLGITNIEEIKYAEDNGMNVILTDHHLPLHEIINRKGEEIRKEILPPALAIINVQLEREEYENKGLCGAATAWKLVCAFLEKYRDEYNIPIGWEKWLLDMVTIATVADMMPLSGENRVLVHYGLKVLAKSPRIGLQKILSIDRIKQKSVIETDISFAIAPRINSAGRLDHPIKAFYTLSNFENKGIDYAVELDNFNKLRKQTVKDINKSIIDKAKDIKEKIIFIGDKDWPIGVVGLVAQEIVKQTGKTTFVWGIDDKGIIKGSSRSGIDKINVTDLSASVKDELIHFGGHEAAGGFAFIDGKQDIIKSMLINNYDKYILENGIFESEILSENELIEKENNIKIDITIQMNIDGEVIDMGFYNKVRELGPFGIGNMSPVFKIIGNIDKIREFGKNKEHIEVNVGGLSCIKFFVTRDEIEKIKSQNEFIGNIEYDNWTGGIRLKMI